MHLNHAETNPLTPGPWKNCLPWNWSLVPKRLGTAGKNRHFSSQFWRSGSPRLSLALGKELNPGSCSFPIWWRKETLSVFLLLEGLPWWLRWERICLQCRRPRFLSWFGKILWRRKWQPIPVFFPGEFHGQRSLAGYSPWGRKAWDMTDWLTP